MRHVLEHNDAWADILANAVESFTMRMCLVLFTPFHGETHRWYEESFGGDPIPTYRFALPDLLDVIYAEQDTSVTLLPDLPSPQTTHKIEHVLLLEKPESA
jgi:hypothetical protein